MSAFSTNQARQLYVVNGLETELKDSHKAGTISVVTDTSKSHLYFGYKGASNIMRSDLIDLSKIISITATGSDKLATTLKSYKVTLDSAINEGNPVGGQDYILRIVFRQYIGMSDEDLMPKYGMVHSYSGMKPSDFYKSLAVSLAKNFSRELTPLLDFILIDHTTSAGAITTNDKMVYVLKGGKVQKVPTLDSGHEYTGIIINEVEQEWTLGIKPQVPVYFTITPTTIIVDGDVRTWGTVEDLTPTKPAGIVKDGKKIADLEYFCMGERGDIYRNINWPNSIPTKYLVDSDKEYDVLDIHYFYSGSNEGVQKSEKTITLVAPHDGTTLNSIITKLETAGLKVNKVGTLNS